MDTDKQYQEAFYAIREHEKEITRHNKRFLHQFGKAAVQAFKDLTDNCSVVGKIEYVDEPKGDEQHEDCGIFKNVFIRQHSMGDSGDSYGGEIYAMVNNQWVSIPYEC
jgi:hypothetical protein